MTTTTSIERELDNFYASALHYGEVVRVATRRKALEDILALTQNCPTAEAIRSAIRGMLDAAPTTIVLHPSTKPQRRKSTR
jgi:hypothetical protein